MLCVLCFVSCNRELDIPTKLYKVRMNICIPVDDQSTGTRRMPGLGDPGTYERFLYPRYLYMFYVWESKTDPSVVQVRRNYFLELSPSKWYDGNYRGSLQHDGDSIFVYDGEIDMLLPNDLSEYNVRLYAAMSYHPLANLETQSVTTEADILNMQFFFEADNDSLPQSLENIYSTPYNYIVDGQYYGTIPFTAIVGHMTLNLMLYHVASKVDLIWNVPDDQQTTFNVKQITAQQLYKKASYIFRPNENQGRPTGAGENYSLNIKTEADVGMQYKGRYYFYTIPYYYTDGVKNYMDIVLDTKFMEGDTERTRTLTLQKAVDTSNPFVPWIRGNMLFTTMPTISQVKIVD